MSDSITWSVLTVAFSISLVTDSLNPIFFLRNTRKDPSSDNRSPNLTGPI